ncbi:MAG TPA: GntR family transcriptional regulator [Pseudonocardia sp.]
MTTVGPVEHQPRSSSAAAAVRRAILDGRLVPGSRINEVQVAAELGFSRGPLREALRALEEEGLIIKEPYRGAFVAEVGPRAIEEIASLRVRLEPFAVELALGELRSATGRHGLEQLMDQLRQSVAEADVASCIDIHLLLHRMIYELSGHKLLLDRWRSWESQLRVYFALDASTFTSLSKLFDDHERFYDLLMNADLAAITAEVVAHVQVAADHAADTVRHGQLSEA